MSVESRDFNREMGFTKLPEKSLNIDIKELKKHKTESWEKLQNTLKTVNNETKKIWDETKKSLKKDEILWKIEVKSIDAIKATKNFAWEREYQNFLNIFKIDKNSPENFIDKVKEIQKEHSLKEDWIIWSKTLEIIYKNYYSKIDKKDLPLEVVSRMDFDTFLKWYEKMKDNPKDNPRNVAMAWIKSAFDRKYYYWENNWENISWTAMNKELYWNISKMNLDSSYNWGNSIQIDKLPNWKYFLALFIDWKLSVLTYVSPGIKGHETPSFKEWKQIWRYINYHKFSGSYPKRETLEKSGWSVMPMSYPIDPANHIYWHVWMVTWDKASHGCIRAPWFYQQAIVKNLEKKPWAFKIKTWDLYA